MRYHNKVHAIVACWKQILRELENIEAQLPQIPHCWLPCREA